MQGHSKANEEPVYGFAVTAEGIAHSNHYGKAEYTAEEIVGEGHNDVWVRRKIVK